MSGRWSDERGKDGFYKEERVLRSRIATEPVMIERTEQAELLAIKWAAQKVYDWAETQWPGGADGPEAIELIRAALEGRLQPAKGE